MANESLKVIITAENKSALDALKQVDAQAKSLGTTFVSTAGKMGDITKSSNTAAFALTNLGRVAQDAPFGFMGIQNNLNPLLESFQRLKTESGSTGGALKALSSSLMGAGGIGLALSVASTAFLLFQNGMMGFNKKATETKEKLDALTESLNSNRKAAAQDLSEMKAYVDAAQNTALSTEQRQIAVDKLLQQYPEYFKGLTVENALTTDLTIGTNALTEAIYKRAAARAMEADVAAKATDVFKEQEKLDKVRIDIEKAQQEVANQRNKGTQIGGGGSLGGLSATSISTAALAEKNLTALLRTQDELLGNIDKKKIDIANTQNRINNLTAQGINLEAKSPGKVKTYEESQPKQMFEDFHGKSKYAEAEPILQRLLDINKAISAEAQKQYDLEIKKELQIRTGSLFNGKFAGVANTAISGELSERDKIKQHRADVDESNDALQSWKDRNAEIQKFNTQMGVSESLANAFGRAFEAIAIAEDPFVAFKDSLKQLIVDLAIAVAKMLIIEAIMAAIDPAGYAARKATGGITGAVGAHARGGVTTGPSMGLIGEAGPEAIMPLNNLKGFVDQAARIGAMNMAGGQSQSMTDRGGEFTLRGNDLVLAVQRAGYSLNLRR